MTQAGLLSFSRLTGSYFSTFPLPLVLSPVPVFFGPVHVTYSLLLQTESGKGLL